MTGPLRVEGSAGEWIRPRLLPWGRRGCPAGAVVPTGFDRIVRVLHPAGDGRTWAEVAATNDRVMHGLVQWACISETFDGRGRSGDVDPEEGSIPAGTLGMVLDHCPASSDVFHAVWDGFGAWEAPARGEPDQLSLPHRTYRVFTAPKEPVTAWPGFSPHWPQSANLIWPADHSWCIATEIDWDFTLIACAEEVAAALLADPRLEAFAVAAEDDLSWLGDTVNPRPAWLESMATAQRPAEPPATAVTHVAGLVLAAGAGSRYGGPKALVRDPDDDLTWVERSVCRLAASGVRVIAVVVGAEADDVSEILLSGAWARVWSPPEPVSVVIVDADDWAEGMGASLRAGLDAIADAFPAEIEALLVTLVDLPDVTSEVHRRVIHSAAHHAPRRGELAAGLWRAAYAAVPGHPVLIGRDHWAGVATSATGDRGARDYLATNQPLLVECGDLASGRDMDTPGGRAQG